MKSPWYHLITYWKRCRNAEACKQVTITIGSLAANVDEAAKESSEIQKRYPKGAIISASIHNTPRGPEPRCMSEAYD